MRSVTLLIDKDKNVFEAPSGSPPPPTPISRVDRLVLKLAPGYTIPVFDELKQLGIVRPNLVMLLNNNGQYLQNWIEGAEVQIDLDEAHRARSASPRPYAELQEGDVMTLTLGWVDPSPRNLTQGGIAAMWMAQFEVVASRPTPEP